VLADALLRASPELRIVATSRQPLGIGGELVFQVPTTASWPRGPPAGSTSSTAA
jgi:predicted ATPase